MPRQKPLPDDGYAKLHNAYVNTGAMARVGHAAWKVLCALMVRSMGKGTCSPSVGILHTDTGVSLRAIQNAQDELVEAGLIRYEATRGGSTTYTLLQPQTMATSAIAAIAIATSAIAPRQPLPQSDPELWQPVLQPISKTQDSRLKDSSLPGLEVEAPKPKPDTKGTRMAEGTRLAPAFRVAAETIATEAGARINVEAVWVYFVDWWAARPGQGGVKTNWLATWRNWVRKECEKAQTVTPPQQGRNVGGGHRPGVVDADLSMEDYAKAAAERARNRTGLTRGGNCDH